MPENILDEYISPHDAAHQLHSVCKELEQLAPEHVDELRQLAQRFLRHLNGVDDVIYSMQDVIRRLPS